MTTCAAARSNPRHTPPEPPAPGARHRARLRGPSSAPDLAHLPPLPRTRPRFSHRPGQERSPPPGARPIPPSLPGGPAVPTTLTYHHDRADLTFTWNLAGRLSPPAPPLRAQARALPGFHRRRSSPHQPSQPDTLRCEVSQPTESEGPVGKMSRTMMGILGTTGVALASLDPVLNDWGGVAGITPATSRCREADQVQPVLADLLKAVRGSSGRTYASSAGMVGRAA